MQQNFFIGFCVVVSGVLGSSLIGRMPWPAYSSPSLPLWESKSSAANSQVTARPWGSGSRESNSVWSRSTVLLFPTWITYTSCPVFHKMTPGMYHDCYWCRTRLFCDDTPLTRCL